MKKMTLKQAAQAVTGIALFALLAGQWALITGPLAEFSEQGRTAAANGNLGEFAGIFGLNVLLTAGLPLIFGGISICVLSAYLSFERIQQRQALAPTVDHRE